MVIIEYKKIKPYKTKDGSIIRELFHPDIHGNRNHSLAEAIIPPGSKTLPHKHMESEEINRALQYYRGEARFDVTGEGHC